VDCSTLGNFSVTQFKKVNGFNGLQFATGKVPQLDINSDGVMDDVAKYSGNLATYTAKHSPSAVRQGSFTYFVYSGEVPLDGDEAGDPRIGSTSAVGCKYEGTELFKDADGRAPALGVFVSRYNHVTGRVAKPTLVHMKCTNDTHDNAVINLDADGYVYLLVSGRAAHRGNFIFRSTEVHSTAGFVDMTPPMDNYLEQFNDIAEAAGIGRPFVGDGYRGINYPKMYWVDTPVGESSGYFRLIYTIYCGAGEPITCGGNRQLYTARMHVETDKVSIQGIQPLAAYNGHYAVAHGKGQDIVVAFNFYLNNNVDDRSNIYYMHSVDGGDTWLNARNEELTLPLVFPSHLDLVTARKFYDSDYAGPIEERVYLKDVNFAGTGLNKTPTILYVGSSSVNHFPSIRTDLYARITIWPRNAGPAVRGSRHVLLTRWIITTRQACCFSAMTGIECSTRTRMTQETMH
jgi:hypothetical protein